MVTPYESYVEVCEMLARVTPGEHAKKSALFNSGAEAVENASRSLATRPAGEPWQCSTTPITGAPISRWR
jgi:4-aminobutyrate aminotransferase/(S)-3-amino-2-methylpropionate transaminase